MLFLAAERRKTLSPPRGSSSVKYCDHGLRGCCPTPIQMVRERPPRSLRSRLPLTRGRFAEGGRGHSPRSRIGGGQQPLRPLRGWETSNLDPFLSRECLRFLIARI